MLGVSAQALLLAVRQALIIATRAIERYLGLGPGRNERRWPAGERRRGRWKAWPTVHAPFTPGYWPGRPTAR